MALSSGNAYYFFSKGTEDQAADRVTANGYWKELDIEEPILASSGNKVGVKKYLVFYVNAQSETNWVMEEFILCHNTFTTTSTRQRNQKLVVIFLNIL